MSYFFRSNNEIKDSKLISKISKNKLLVIEIIPNHHHHNLFVIHLMEKLLEDGKTVESIYQSKTLLSIIEFHNKNFLLIKSYNHIKIFFDSSDNFFLSVLYRIFSSRN
jgi:hypothetical protein